jgi:L-galactose dehydrogenase
MLSPACCRNPSITTTLVGMASTAVVQANVHAVMQKLGYEPDPTRTLDKAMTREVERILAPVMGVSWPSGRPENND